MVPPLDFAIRQTIRQIAAQVLRERQLLHANDHDPLAVSDQIAERVAREVARLSEPAIATFVSLLPCPFCGHEAESIRWQSRQGVPRAIVRCTNERCAAAPEVAAVTAHDAATAWNTRPDGATKKDRP